MPPHRAPDIGCRLVSLRLLKRIAGHRAWRCASCLPTVHFLLRLLFHMLDLLCASLLLLLLNALLLLPGGETLEPRLFLLLLLAQLPATYAAVTSGRRLHLRQGCAMTCTVFACLCVLPNRHEHALLMRLPIRCNALSGNFLPLLVFFPPDVPLSVPTPACIPLSSAVSMPAFVAASVMPVPLPAPASCTSTLPAVAPRPLAIPVTTPAALPGHKNKLASQCPMLCNSANR